MTVCTVETITITEHKSPRLQPNLREKLSLGKLRALIPKECFEKSLSKSLLYMALDFGLLAAGAYAYGPLVAGSLLLTPLWWAYMGFFMWALFVIGHDCGHGTFSDYEWVNAVCGHVCHAVLCVPFWPWAKSHHQHHMYHNHVEKDMSFPWMTKERWESGIPAPFRWLMLSPIHPFVSFGIGYLFFGVNDGSHFNPLGCLFWNRREQVQCAVSVATVAAFLYVLIELCFARDWTAIAIQYLAPWFVYNYWLVMVTYMQHHHDDSITFDDSDFHFALAALETVDRKYGWGIDGMHHNITDGHVAHHLFFTKIPHYNLSKATQALQPYLKELGVYRSQSNPFFLFDFIVTTYQCNFSHHSKSGRAESKKTH